GHFLAAPFVDPFVADPALGALLELVEGDALLLHRAEELHGHVDEAEADRTAPDRTWHGRCLPAWATQRTWTWTRATGSTHRSSRRRGTSSPRSSGTRR